MAKKCPNIKHPDWVALVEKHGENGAWKKFIENDYEIPSPENGNSKSGPISISKIFNGVRDMFSAKSTLDTIDRHPDILKRIVDNMKKNFPDMRIQEGFLYDEDGNKVDIPPGKVGMHYRSAFTSAIAYANDAYMETIPHEYAHEYIDMFRNTDLVRKAIDKYGEERLVTLIARKYTGQQMSNSFEKFLSNFWKMIRNVFSSPSVIDELTDAFAKNERLGEPLSRGTAIYNYQDIQKPLVFGKNNIADFNDDIKTEAKDLKEITDEEVRTSVYDELFKQHEKIVVNKSNDKTYIPKELIQEKVNEIINNKNFIKLSDDEKSYINTKTGKKLKRVTTVISDEVFEETELLKSSQIIGTKIDVLVRDFFADELKPLNEYDVSSIEEVTKFVEELKNIKKNIEDRGETVLANDIILYNDELGVAGTVDLLTYDKNGEFRIYDMKTMRGDNFAKNKYGETKYDTKKVFEPTGRLKADGTKEMRVVPNKEKDSKREKHQKQLSMYRMLLNNTHGVLVGTIGIMPIQIEYEAGDNKTKTIDLKKGIQLNPLNNINGLTLKESPNNIKEQKQVELTEDEQLEIIGKFWTRTARGIAGIKDDNRKTKNIAPVDESIVSYINDVLPNNKENKIALTKKFIGEDVKLTKEQQRIYDNIIRLRKGIMHYQLVKDSYIDGDKIVNKSVIDNVNINDINNQSKKINENLKSKNKFLRWSAELLTKGLQYVANTRLWAKYLSGSENSLFSEITVKGLLNGRIGFSDYYFKFNDIVSGIDTELKKHSTFHNKKSTIDDFETITLSLNKDINQGADISELKLIQTELLLIYLIDRREGGRYNLTKNGMRPQNIEGRDIDLDYAYRLTDDQVDNINALIENNSAMMEAVAKIDEAMELSHNMLNPIHKKLNGFDLEKHENYFPFFHGKHTDSRKKEKNVIENQRSFRMYVPEGGGPVKLEDPFKTLSNLQMANATYIGYAIPIHNAQLAINALKGKYSKKGSREYMYLQQLEGTIQKIQDPSLLYSTQGEDKISRILSKVQGNFTVATLAMNLGVIFKQQLSLTTAELEINPKFLRQSGTSMGPFNIINPIDVFKQLSLTGKETMIPVEWKNTIDDKDLQELIDNSPLAKERTMGLISKESGEAIMSKDSAEDKVKIPFLKNNGKAVYMSKSRVMMGITMMDTLAIMRLYKAVKLETESRMNEPGFANMTEEQILSHNLARFQEIVDKTQPTFDQVNRTGLARDSNPLVRAITMFTSATSKMSMELIDSIVDYNQNPTRQNFLKFFGRVNNLGVKTAVQLIVIDMIWQGLRGGWDDDEWEKLPEKMLKTGVMSTVGSTQGVGTALGIFISQIDSEPWTQTLQDPTQMIVQDAMNAAANLSKGNIGAAAQKGAETIFGTLGVPKTPLKFGAGWASKLTEN